MKRSMIFILFLLFPAIAVFAQVAINKTGSLPDPSAGLDVKFTDKGVLVPRLTAGQRAAIPQPAAGLLVYQTSVPAGFWFFNGSLWTRLTVSADSGTINYTARWRPDNLLVKSMLYDNGAGIGIGTTKIHGKLNFSSNGNGISWGAGNSRLFDNGNLHIETNDQLFFDDDYGLTALFMNTTTGMVGIGTTTPAAKLQIASGAIVPAPGNSASAGIQFPPNPGGGTGDTAYIRYYVESGENTKLVIANNSDGNDDISFLQHGQERMNIINGQVGIGITYPQASAIVDVTSTTKGVLFPRMTEIQRTAIVAPASGLLVFQTDAITGFYFYTGTAWSFLGPGEGGGGHVIDADGNVYPTTRIGTREWMAENLKVTHYRNGDAIPNVTDNTAWGALTTGGYCWYDNNQPANEIYGALYNWHAVNDARGLCPAGWHVPANSEWTTMFNSLEGNGFSGHAISTNGKLWIFSYPSFGPDNSSGFSAIPGGQRDSAGLYGWLRVAENWWTATSGTLGFADGWWLWNVDGSSHMEAKNSKTEFGFNVRCIRDFADPLSSPAAGIHVQLPHQVVWNWNAVPSAATGYKWNTVNNYATAIDKLTGTSHVDTGLLCGTTYNRYVWAYNEYQVSAATTLTSIVASGPPNPPAAGAHVATPCQIVWNWNVSAGAIGYKWNTVNDLATSIEMAAVRTKAEMVTVPDSIYTRFVWAYNGCNFSAATVLTCQSSPGGCMGQNAGGGIVFYIDETGQHGLISATADLANANWGCSWSEIGTSTAIGAGQTNTTAIVNACSEPGIAARICSDLVLNGYDDWFLPSKDELNIMYNQKGIIGGFLDNRYWSSSDASIGFRRPRILGWSQDFLNGIQREEHKSLFLNVRAVRAF